MSRAHEEEDFLRRFGQRVRLERRARKLSQENLAEEVELSRGEISKIERAKLACSVRIAFRLARTFSLGLEEMMQAGPSDQGDLLMRIALSNVKPVDRYRAAGVIAVLSSPMLTAREVVPLLPRPGKKKVPRRRR